jgi:CheY-specific phosphatase CheX
MRKLLIISNSPERVEDLRSKAASSWPVDVIPPGRLEPLESGQILLCDFDEQGRPTLAELERVLPACPPTVVVAGITEQYFWAHPEVLTEPIQAVLMRPYDPEALRWAVTDSIPWNLRPSSAGRDMIGVLIEATTSVIGGYDASTRLCGVWAMNRLSPQGQIGGAMPLTGELRAQAVLSMSQKTARQLSARLVGCSPDNIDSSDAHDGVGEIVNQICGHGMTMLSRRQRRINIALPTLFTGSNVPKELQQCISFLTMLFRSGDEYFTFQLCFPPAATQLCPPVKNQSSAPQQTG